MSSFARVPNSTLSGVREPRREREVGHILPPHLTAAVVGERDKTWELQSQTRNMSSMHSPNH